VLILLSLSLFKITLLCVIFAVLYFLYAGIDIDVYVSFFAFAISPHGYKFIIISMLIVDVFMMYYIQMQFFKCITSMPQCK